MSLKTRLLFTGDPIEIRRDEALRALGAAVAQLGSDDLWDSALPARLVERLLPRPPRLGRQIRYRLFEIECDNEDERTGRWGVGLEATLRFWGEAEYFNLRAGAQPLHPPVGMVRGRSLTLTVLSADGSDNLIDLIDAQLETVRRELEEQRRRCEGMRDGLEAEAGRLMAARRTRMTMVAETTAVLSARGWIPEDRKG